MEFLYPNMLFGLIALAIPIIVHLFNFRKHKVVLFSNIQLLKNIQQQTAKTNKLKYLLVLAMRLLFIAALVFAFARPYFSSEKSMQGGSETLVSVYVDNSMSMNAFSGSSTAIGEARRFAQDFIQKMDPSSKFVLLTNDFDSRHEYPMNRTEIRSFIEQIEANTQFVPLKNILERAAVIAEKHNLKTHYLLFLSDFQQQMLDLDAIQVDTTLQIILKAFVPDASSNSYIDSCWLATPVLQQGISNDLFVNIVNDAPDEVKGLVVRLEINEKTVATSNIDIDANASKEIQMQFDLPKSGFYEGKVTINDQPIVFDDTYYFSLNVKPIIKVLEISDSKTRSPLAALFDDDDLFEYSCVSDLQVDLQSLPDYQVVFVNNSKALPATTQQFLIDYAHGGGVVCLFAANEPNELLNNALKLRVEKMPDNAPTRVNSIVSTHPFFENIFVKIPDNADFPLVQSHYRIAKQQGSSSSVELIRLLNGNPFLMQSEIGSGSVFHFAVPLDTRWSGLTENALFVPVVYKMAFVGNHVGKMAYTIGRDKNVLLERKLNGSEMVKITDKNNNLELIPQLQQNENRSWIQFIDAVPSAGFYSVFIDNKPIQTMAWNDDRLESKMQFASVENVAKILSEKGYHVHTVLTNQNLNTADDMEQILNKSYLWKLFVALALLGLTTEILILRFWRTTKQEHL
ncbi:MAG: BatA and WFA domain-containing protein [Lentimicrobiaceae bacterium]|jgi:hypothetical protein|nr:BatA and WFA domain-containing protein [Lentimicrobiaceae bacterium]